MTDKTRSNDDVYEEWKEYISKRNDFHKKTC
jgi:hypothetical protein